MNEPIDHPRRSKRHMADQWAGKAFTELAGWFGWLTPLRGLVLGSIALVAGTLWVENTVSGILATPETLAAVDTRLTTIVDSLGADILILEAYVEEDRTNDAALVAMATNFAEDFSAFEDMLNELFCDRFPQGSPRGVRCQLTAVPVR